MDPHTIVKKLIPSNETHHGKDAYEEGTLVVNSTDGLNGLIGKAFIDVFNDNDNEELIRQQTICLMGEAPKAIKNLMLLGLELQIGGDISFYNALVGDTSVEVDKLKGVIDVKNTTFQGKFDGSMTRFEEAVYFMDVIFQEGIKLTSSNFKTLQMHQATFKKNALLKYSCIEEMSSIYDCNFETNLYMADFYLGSHLDMSDTKVKGLFQFSQLLEKPYRFSRNRNVGSIICSKPGTSFGKVIAPATSGLHQFVRKQK